jgi:CBS domain-containing protein
MGTVLQILQTKGSQIYSIGPDRTVFEALKLMADRQIGALLVMEGDKLVGIVTERDYARKIALENRSSRDTLVRDVMTRRVLCVRPEQTIEECMALMTDKRNRHLPVVDHKRVIGVLSIGDLVKAIIGEQKFVIEQLQHYISG